MGPSVSAILLSYRRRRNLPRILESLAAWPRTGEVMVWNNDPAVPVDLPGAVVFESPRNYHCLPRLCLVPLARHETILFHDDDLVLSPEQLEKVHAAYIGDPGRLYGCRGRGLLPDGRYTTDTVIGECDIVLGSLVLFRRELALRAFPLLSRVPEITVEDDVFLSLALGRKHLAVDVGPFEEPGWDDESALWRRSDHFEKRRRMAEAVRAALAGRERP